MYSILHVSMIVSDTRRALAFYCDVLGMPVKIGIPTGFSGGLVREIENPAYSTAVGLVIHGLRNFGRAPMPQASTGRERSVGAMARKMKEWFDQL